MPIRNPYVVHGEKTALTDLTEDVDCNTMAFEDKPNSISLQANDIDYLIHNHMEPDHTGRLSTLHSKSSFS